MTKVTDLDADLELEEVEELTVPVKLFGHEFRLLTGLNGYTLSRLMTNDPGALSTFVDQMIHPDDQAAFRTVMSEQRSLKKPENLTKVLTSLIEVASDGVPTTRPSASSRTASKRTSSPKSALTPTRRAAAARSTRR